MHTSGALNIGPTRSRATTSPQRRDFIGVTSILAAAAIVGCPQAALAADERKIRLAGIEYTPAAMVLQMAEQTASMEGIVRQSAKEMVELKLTEQQRDERGAKNLGPGVVRREDMLRSIDVMIKNSQLTSIPGGEDAAATLRGIQIIANAGQGALSADEYEQMAKQYSNAREDLSRAFQAMGPEAQAEGKAFIRGIRLRDEQRMKQMEDEEEKLRLLRVKMQADAEALARGQVAAPQMPRKKTLAELEAAQNKAFGEGKQQPVMSLYAR